MDATVHLYQLHDCAARWVQVNDRENNEMFEKAAQLRVFLQHELFDEETGWFHDIWAMQDKTKRGWAVSTKKSKMISVIEYAHGSSYITTPELILCHR